MGKECWLEQGIALFGAGRAHCWVLSVLIQKEPAVLSCALNVFLILSVWGFLSWLTLSVTACSFSRFILFSCISSLPCFRIQLRTLRFYLLCLNVWVFCLDVWLYHGCTVPTEARRGLPVLWVWNNRWLWATMWVMRIKPRSLQEQPVPLISEPFFIPWSQKFEHARCALHHCCLLRSCDCKCLVWAVILVVMNQPCSWLATSEQWYSFSYLVFTAPLCFACLVPLSEA